MTLQARVFDVGVTLVIALIFHELIVRKLRAEVASLRKLMSKLPAAIVDLLVEQGHIEPNREPAILASIGKILGVGEDAIGPSESGKEVMGPAERYLIRRQRERTRTPRP
jgi:hypothetical protein